MPDRLPKIEKAAEELKNSFSQHQREDQDNFGKLFNEMKRNTDLTEAVVQRQSGVESHLQDFSGFMGEVREFMRGNIVYMKNIEERTVENRKDIVELDKKVSIAEGAAKIAGIVWGGVSAVIAGIIIYVITKHL